MADTYKNVTYENCQVGDIKTILKDVPDEYRFIVFSKGCYSQNVKVDVDHTLNLVTIGDKPPRRFL